MRKLDHVDSKILKDLLTDGRKSFTKIAEECHETKATISKRYQTMVKLGIIKGATLQINHSTYGYNTVGTLSFKVNPENAELVKKYLLTNSDMYILLGSEHAHFLAIVTLKNMEELNNAKEAIRNFPTVRDLETHLWLGVRNMPENIQILHSEQQHIYKTLYYTKKPSDFEIDALDHQIIEALSANSRTPFTSLAKKMGVATGTVISKYEKLKRNGIISSSIQIDPTKLGYHGRAVFNLAFVPETSLAVIVDKISKIPGVTLIIKTCSGFDLSVFAEARDIEQILALQDKLIDIAKLSKMELLLFKARDTIPGHKEYISTF